MPEIYEDSDLLIKKVSKSIACYTYKQTPEALLSAIKAVVLLTT